MTRTNTFALTLRCRRTKPNSSQGLLFVRVVVNGTTLEISLKEKVSLSAWNEEKGEVDGRVPEAKALNNYLKNVLFRLREKYRTMIDKGEEVTAQNIKDSFTGNEREPHEHSLCELMKYHYELEGEKLSWGTMKNYKTTEEYIKRFIQHKHKSADLYLSQLNHAFIRELESFIRKNPIKAHDRCEGNGIMKHLERLKKMIHWGRQLGWLTQDPFIDYRLSYKKFKRKKLDLTELQKIEALSVSGDSLLLVKDLFLFSCYTGLAYADTIALTPENLEQDNRGKWWCKIYRQKSDEFAAIPLLSVAIQYLEKYANHPKSVCAGRVFPYVSNQEVNRNLKIIGNLCGITKYMSFHLARHTFATTVTLKNGVPIETVSKMLGHKKISTTQIYADVDEEKLFHDMEGVEKKFAK